MLRLLMFTCLLGLIQADTVILNQAVDQMLEGIRQQVRDQNMDSIPIEEMSHTWSYKWKHFIHLSGRVDCRNGWVKSLTTIQRTGDVVMTTQGNQIILNIALGLGYLETGFDHCRFKAKHLFQLTQKISAKISSNSVVAQATITRNGNQCTSTLDKLELAHIGKITVHTGGGQIHKIEDKILDWVAKHIHNKIVNNLSNHLQDLARNNLNRADLCNKIKQ